MSRTGAIYTISGLFTNQPICEHHGGHKVKKQLGTLITIGLLSLITSCGRVTPTAAPAVPTPTQVPSADAPTTPTAAASPSDTRTRSADKMAIIAVPGGTFRMGSTAGEVDDAIALCKEHYSICNSWYYMRENPQHAVTLDSFWMDQTEVSNAQYRQCVQAGNCTEPTTCKKGAPTYADPGKTDHPVVCVSWEEAQNYCQWAGGRLPTEAEWEYALRGEAGFIYPWGDEFDGSKLNYCDQNCSQSHADDRFDDGYPQTAPVGSYPRGASWSGVLDMGGNVSEWVADWLGEYSSDAVSNPSGPSTGEEKIVKGGSWFFHPTYCRGATRASVDPDTRFDFFGFRCVAPVKLGSEGGADMITDAIVVPSGNPPTIDGTLSPGEWDNAKVETFADGSELLLTYAGNYLYLGIRSNTPGMIAGNVLIKRGDEIAILHSSAALGTAIYQHGEDSWHQIQNFTWCCRDTSNSESSQADREEFLQDEGWVAVNSRMGIPEELEYQIDVTGAPIQLAVNFLRASNPNEKIPWPADLDDDCIKPTPGGLPENLFFSPEQWATLDVSR